MSDQPRSFDEFELTKQTQKALTDMEFEAPTEVQHESFQPILDGKDLMVQARTGTGKTAAFAIPMADRLLSEETVPQMLALCPTRELALQVAGELSSIGKHRDLKVAPVYGGAAISKQISQLEEGVHAVVGTPGRVLDLIRRGHFKLDNIRFLVLDEADEMLSMGFEKEISAIIEQLPTRRQTLLFSATIPNDIQRLSQRYLNEPTVLSLSDDYVGAKEVEHAFYMVSGTGRLADLIKVIDVEDPDSALIFCNTRDDVQLVANGLKRQGFNVEWISSDLSQNEREAAMKRMRGEDVRFLVATDVAARGIDISHVTHVINYTFPESLEVYIHRTGRTGRMGRTGWAISLITPRDVGNLYFLKLQYRITPIERDLPTTGEMAARLESDILAKLIEDHRGASNEATLSLARRVQNHARGTEIIAGLLQSTLDSLDGEEPKTIRRGRKSPPVKVSEKKKAEETESPRRSRSKSAPLTERPSKQANAPEAPQNEDSAPQPEPSDERNGRDGDDGRLTFKEIYLSVGRRDGVRAGQISELLEQAGIERDNIGRIRVRDRSTFVGVNAEHSDAAIAALDGAKIGDRVAMAELARRSRNA